jgi:hypothetical protein
MKCDQASSIVSNAGVNKQMAISALALAVMFLSGVPARAQGRTCSNANLEGAYGSSVGMIVLPAGTPRAVLLRFSFDGKGNFTNTLTMNDNGTIIHSSDFGTYTVNPDCTGTIFTNGGTRTVEIVLVDGGNEFYSIRTNPSNLVFLFHSAKKIFPGNGQAQAQ